MIRFFRAFILLVLWAVPASCWAWDWKPKNLESCGVLAGFGTASLREQGAYLTAPLALDADFTLKPLLEKFHGKYPGLLQVQIEPYLAPIVHPHTGMELGNFFFLKVGLVPQSWKFQPFVKAGAGVSYMTLHTREQGNQFNFIEAFAVGAHYFFKKNLGLTAEGRIRHLSNASLWYPNKGIDSYYGMLGAVYTF